MSERPDLLALLGSRICHDLISPIGAIGNGVELMLMEPGGASPEVTLIAESVAHANARIRFFRIGFGIAGAGQGIGRAEITAILADLTRGGRMSIDWTSPADLPRREVKLAFLLLMCMETALAFGGHVTVMRDAARWQIIAQAPRLKLDPALWAMLAPPAAGVAVTAAQVHFALAAEEAALQARDLTVDIGEGEIRLGF